MIGNEDNARLALDGYLRLLSAHGSTRIVYIADDVVYKIEAYGEIGTNLAEYDNASRLNAILPEGYFVPEVALYDFTDGNVLAMDYITGQEMGECYCLDNEPHTDTCMPFEACRVIAQYITDNSGMNVILTPSGEYALIDVAC